ncbi:MAG: hypothetical protein ABJG55_10725 [Paracoccaceae bacterium]
MLRDTQFDRVLQVQQRFEIRKFKRVIEEYFKNICMSEHYLQDSEKFPK